MIKHKFYGGRSSCDGGSVGLQQIEGSSYERSMLVDLFFSIFKCYAFINNIRENLFSDAAMTSTMAYPSSV